MGQRALAGPEPLVLVLMVLGQLAPGALEQKLLAASGLKERAPTRSCTMNWVSLELGQHHR